MTTNTNGYALVDYDVHKDPKLPASEAKKEVVATYTVIYKHLNRISLRFTDSVYMVRESFMHQVEIAFLKINEELREKEMLEVEFHVTPVSEEAVETMRSRSVKSLNEQTREVAASLIGRIERLEEKFNDATDDPNKHLYKVRLAVARAKRELEQARGLAMLFLIEGDVLSAIDATQKVIEVEAERRALKKAALIEAK